MSRNLFTHKYQPRSLAEFQFSPEFHNILHMLISTDMLNILFVGDFGTGKSSILHGMVKEYYAGYNDVDIGRNVLYINNLKEQGISYYRSDVKTFCQTSSTINNKKKIIVMDDFDLISDQSQQAFRNSIDKYNRNVHFIASCTNIQKVVDNMQSRFMIVKLQPHTHAVMNHIMKQVIQAEEIDIEEDAKTFLINISNFSIKTMLNYLEKFKLIQEPIDRDTAIQLCTNISIRVFETYLEQLRKKDLVGSIHMLYELTDKGYSVMDILDSFFVFVKQTDTLSESEKYKIVPIICKYITIFHNIHEDEIELPMFTNNVFNVIHAA